MPGDTTSRREFVLSSAGVVGAAFAGHASAQSVPELRVTEFELLPLRATSRTVWLIVRLRTTTGISGLGEASDAFGFANTTSSDAALMRAQLAAFFALIEGRSPFAIASFREGGERMARQDLVAATAFSAIEQALWDIVGRALDVPTHVLFGGQLRELLPVYANINRATQPRTPDGFADAALRAVRDGFQAVKAAPFDGFPAPGSPRDEIEAAVEAGIASIVRMREAIGGTVDLMIDCHSFFDVDLAARVARRVEAQNLAWYEEPVPPENVEDTLEIGRRIVQPMAGGELLYGLAGFRPLIESRAFDVIMPDVKHCGGLLEMTHIAAAARGRDIAVAPHNPSGPISTAATVQVCSAIPNASFLELQYGEVDWRGDVLIPPEEFEDGQMRVPDRPGFGVDLDDTVVLQRAMEAEQPR